MSSQRLPTAEDAGSRATAPAAIGATPPAFAAFEGLLRPVLQQQANWGRADEKYDGAPLQFDRAYQAMIGQATGGLSPAALTSAYMDWLIHLSMAPGKQSELVSKAYRKWWRLQMHAAQAMAAPYSTTPCIDPLPQDRRFADPAWKSLPWSVNYQSFLLVQQWWYNATTTVPGVSDHHERILEFASRQWLDLWSPANFIATNPAVLQKTLTSGGFNLVNGLFNALQTMEQQATRQPPPGSEKFRPGETVAVTPGKVIYRNHLIELIQYAPTTETTHHEPVLIVPAWIMKYYILDLSPHNSMIRYLVEQGHTVFAISWRNVDAKDREIGLDDYRKLGVLDALRVINGVLPGRKVHAAGYCLGGTLLSITAAAMAREHDDRLQSVTLLAAQTDFSEPGELQLFLDESQITLLESMMWEKGYLDARQMSGAFEMLRSQDLVFSRMVNEYLMGDRRELNDLMAWNTDGTRLPARMHSEYLRSMFLRNELADGKYLVDGRPISLRDIECPIFAVGTTRDHVAPWRSVFKIHNLSDVDVTFVLTNGGHNAGIVSEPGHARRHYQIATHHPTEQAVDPESWEATTASNNGSWWPAWSEWMAERSSGRQDPPNELGAPQTFPPLCDAPGTYIHQR